MKKYAALLLALTLTVLLATFWGYLLMQSSGGTP